jgi:hypothetical protein
MAADKPSPAYARDELVPLIVIEDVPLIDAIKNLARQMEMNFILDPRVPGSGFGVGRRAPQPTVSMRWEDVTAGAALADILRSNRLVMVTNPATSVARIAPVRRAIKPVAASQVGNATNAVIPLLVMDDISLSEAIRKLADAAQLTVSLDPKVRTSPLFDTEGVVSFRWQKITARQALVALLDNHDLLLVEEPATASARIVLKSQAATEKSPQ